MPPELEKALAAAHKDGDLHGTGAAAAYKIADHLAKGASSAKQIATASVAGDLDHFLA
jgi:hypothetical protein